MTNPVTFYTCSTKALLFPRHMRVVFIACRLWSLGFAAEQLSGFLASARKDLEEFEEICTKAYYLLRKRSVVETALTVSGIERIVNFKQCSRFYERRLTVANPHIISDSFDRKYLLEKSLKSLASSFHSWYDLGKDLIESSRKSFGELELNFELSVLLLSEYLIMKHSQQFSVAMSGCLSEKFEVPFHIVNQQPLSSSPALTSLKTVSMATTS